MSSAFEFTLNGRPVRVEAVSPNTTLLEFLRASGLTGTKEGCAEGDCGACSVVLIERDANGKAAYRAVNSCLMPVCLLAGREVVSVEGVCQSKIQNPKSKIETLHPVQRTLAEGYGAQCGYCTPGFICSLFEGYYRDDLHTHDDLDDQLSGNLCRCTGYRPIRDAAMAAFPGRRKNEECRNGDDEFVERLKNSDAQFASANYEFAGEKFFRPTSLAELFELKKKFPDAKLIAGATELGLEITKRYKKFSTLIATEAVAELTEIKSTATEWHVGGAVTLTVIKDKLGVEFPMLNDMLRVFGSRQIRNRATLGGNLVTASPIGDSAPVLLALGAQVVIVGQASCLSKAEGVSPSTQRNTGETPSDWTGGTPVPLHERTLPISDFFLAYRKTALLPGEVLKTIIVPRGISATGLTRKAAWFKVSKRREMDISTVAGAFVADVDAQNFVRHVRLGYGGVAAMPTRAKKTEAALLGKVWSEATIASVLPILQTEFTPISDVRGTAEYRSGLITSLLEKFFAGDRSADGSSASLSLPRKHADEAVRAPAHESAHKHVTGESIYTDDFGARRKMLEVWPVCAPHARAKILKRDAAAAKTMPGVAAVLLAEDVPGLNDVGAVRHDEVLLADKEVFYHSQIIALVVGETQEACRNAAAKIVVEYEPLLPILKIEDAIAQNSFHYEPNFIRRGDVFKVFGSAGVSPAESSVTPDSLVTQNLVGRNFRRDAENHPRDAGATQILEGEFSFGGQEHFYLEMQAAYAEPGEDGSMFVMSSTQHPSEVQQIVAHVLNVPSNHVVVQSPRMGGGFGGKETQAATFAAFAALAAAKTKQPVRVRVNRDLDMMITGKRHPFLARFKVGHDADGKLLAAKIELFSNGGWSLDLSMPVTDRALFHLDNAYYIPHVEFSGQAMKTNVASNTAFRGFGGPQGMLVIEEIIDRIARRLGKSPEAIRELNLYHGKDETNTTHYGQEIADNRIERVWNELKTSSQFEKRRAEIAQWNSQNPHRKRGLAMTPVKFGISFTLTHLNQAGALVLIYQDGTVQVNHGGTEMGQGLHTNMAMVAAKELGLSLDKVRVMPTSTDKVPNTSATAASCGTDLNGMAVKNACDILRERLAPVAAKMFSEKLGREISSGTISFKDDFVFAPGSAPASGAADDASSPAQRAPSRVDTSRGGALGAVDGASTATAGAAVLPISITFAKVVQSAYVQRISLSSTGFYRTPEIHYDRAKGQGKPFHYFAVGAAVTEVEVDGLTGMMRILRADILQDAGNSINPGINVGQIEGAYVQGAGWLTCEELIWNDAGVLLTHSPDTYKIPAVGDRPLEFNVKLLENATQANTIFGSKAVGEPPLMLAISVREAIRDAVAAFGSGKGEIALRSPATSEAIWLAIQNVQRGEQRPG
jgi:xanthine dehydrogenase small subunit